MTDALPLIVTFSYEERTIGRLEILRTEPSTLESPVEGKAKYTATLTIGSGAQTVERVEHDRADGFVFLVFSALNHLLHDGVQIVKVP